jgi:hypothetical protein
VNHRTNARFWRCYRRLPKDIRDLADRNYATLKVDSNHRALHFKKIGELWSARVGLHYRALATESESDLVWFWIGPHAEYDKLVGRKPANQALQPSSRARMTGDKSKRRSRAARG